MHESTDFVIALLFEQHSGELLLFYERSFEVQE